MRHPISLRLLTITLVFVGPVGRSEAAAPLSSAPVVSNPQMTAPLMRLPLQFEANQGQVDEQVMFLLVAPATASFSRHPNRSWCCNSGSRPRRRLSGGAASPSLGRSRRRSSRRSCG